MENIKFIIDDEHGCGGSDDQDGGGGYPEMQRIEGMEDIQRRRGWRGCRGWTDGWNGEIVSVMAGAFTQAAMA